MRTDSATVAHEVEDGVGTMLLNRPDARNAVNMQLAQDLYAAVKALEADEAVRRRPDPRRRAQLLRRRRPEGAGRRDGGRGCASAA